MRRRLALPILLGSWALILQMPATTPVAATSAFSFNWTGTPAQPQAWIPGSVDNWDLLIHNRDTWQSLDPVHAQHGPNCEAFNPADFFATTHIVTQLQDAAYICNNHMMTALNATGYGLISFTPAQMVDFASGATVQVSTTSIRTAGRDFIDFWIMPFSENLIAPFSSDFAVDLNGPAKDGINVLENFGAAVGTTWKVEEYRDFQQTEYDGTGNTVDGCTGSAGISALRRDPNILTLSPNHLNLTMTVNGVPCTLIDTDIANPGFTTGVVEIGDHSYNPEKDGDTNVALVSGVSPTGSTGNTWHWSNFIISNAVPFTILRGDAPATGINAGTTSQVNFPAPAPPGSYLRFSGESKRYTMQVSYDGGATWTQAQEQAQCGVQCQGIDPNHAISYWTPVPAGITSVRFRAQDLYTPWDVQDPSIWSQTPPSQCSEAAPTATSASGAPGAAGTSAQVEATWTPPTACGQVAGYAVYRYGSDGTISLGQAAGTSLPETGLTHGVYYTFTVAAWSGGVWHPWSPWSPWMRDS